MMMKKKLITPFHNQNKYSLRSKDRNYIQSDIIPTNEHLLFVDIKMI